MCLEKYSAQNIRTYYVPTNETQNRNKKHVRRGHKIEAVCVGHK